jgi:hypothetical protein
MKGVMTAVQNGCPGKAIIKLLDSRVQWIPAVYSRNINLRGKSITLRFFLPILSLYLNFDTKVLSIV